jgi:putative MATE family efflux protein
MNSRSALTQDLTQGNINAHLVRMTIPMFLGMASMILASMIDTIYVGLLGARELAAYSFTFPLLMGLSSVSMGIGMGAASLIARSQGAGDHHQVRLLTTHTMLLTLILVILVMFLSFIYLDEIFQLMGTQDDILPLVNEFMEVWILGLFLFTLPMVASTVLRAVGNAKVPGYVMTTTSALQVVIAPLLIFGLLGAPELGFVGSAWAFVASSAVRAVAMFWLLIVQERLLLVGPGSLRGLRKSLKDISYIAVPSMLNSLIAPVSMAVTIWLLSSHGPEVVAAFGITSRFEMLILMVLMSLSSSIGPFVGQNWGARKIDRVYSGLRTTYIFSLVWGLLCFAVLAPFGDDLVKLVNSDPALVISAGLYLMVVPFSYGILGIGNMAGSTFIALGRPIPTTILAILRMFVIYIPLALLLNELYGYLGIFVATFVANVLIGIVALTWSRRLIRREAQAIGLPAST